MPFAILPRYTVTYDGNIVMKYLKGASLEGISLMMLSRKLATLLYFLTGQRDQSINEIDINFMYKDKKNIVFYIPTIFKTNIP